MRLRGAISRCWSGRERTVVCGMRPPAQLLPRRVTWSCWSGWETLDVPGIHLHAPAPSRWAMLRCWHGQGRMVAHGTWSFYARVLILYRSKDLLWDLTKEVYIYEVVFEIMYIDQLQQSFNSRNRKRHTTPSSSLHTLHTTLHPSGS